MDDRVMGMAEARSSLSALVDGMTAHQIDVAIIGSHRKPEAAILPYSVYLELKNSATGTVGLEQIQSRRDLIKRLGTVWGFDHVAVFGSVARGEQRSDSDIDFLVDAKPGASLFDIAGFETDLEQVLGRPVDVITRSALDLTRPRDKAMLDQSIPL
jgi:predicted nucleotidyltransferase